MAITHAGFTGTVDQVDFSQILDGLSGHGVVGTYNDSSLSAAKVVGSRTMLVQPGYVYAPGVLAHLDAAANAVAAPALSGSNPRIDVLIAKFNWNTGAVTFEMKAGTQAASPVPPTLQQDPGDIFEVPLRQGTLTNAVGGEYTTATMADRRYWLEDGHFVMPSTTILPQSAKAGTLVHLPDVKQILAYNGTTWDTFQAQTSSLLTVESNQDLLSLFYTEFSPASPTLPGSVVGGSFIGPSSGRVKITTKGHIQQNSAGGYAYLSFELRSGSTVGSGSPVVPANADNGIGTSGRIAADASTWVSVTPEAPYNVRTMHYTEAAGATGFNIYYRHLAVEVA